MGGGFEGDVLECQGWDLFEHGMSYEFQPKVTKTTECYGKGHGAGYGSTLFMMLNERPTFDSYEVKQTYRKMRGVSLILNEYKVKWRVENLEAY